MDSAMINSKLLAERMKISMVAGAVVFPGTAGSIDADGVKVSAPEPEPTPATEADPGGGEYFLDRAGAHSSPQFSPIVPTNPR